MGVSHLEDIILEPVPGDPTRVKPLFGPERKTVREVFWEDIEGVPPDKGTREGALSAMSQATRERWERDAAVHWQERVNPRSTVQLWEWTDTQEAQCHV